MLRKTFTVAQANALVPWLQQEFDVTRRLSAQLRDLRAELAAPIPMEAGQGGGLADAKQETLARISRLEREVKERLESIVSLGIEVRRVDGLVDFPAWLEGQMVFLCWRSGETEIAHWHATTKGFEARRPLPEHTRSKAPLVN